MRTHLTIVHGLHKAAGAALIARATRLRARRVRIPTADLAIDSLARRLAGRVLANTRVRLTSAQRVTPSRARRAARVRALLGCETVFTARCARALCRESVEAAGVAVLALASLVRREATSATRSLAAIAFVAAVALVALASIATWVRRRKKRANKATIVRTPRRRCRATWWVHSAPATAAKRTPQNKAAARLAASASMRQSCGHAHRASGVQRAALHNCPARRADIARPRKRSRRCRAMEWEAIVHKEASLWVFVQSVFIALHQPPR